MSIRARFTLLYNLILFITLVVFSAALYGIQARSTLNSLKKDLIYSSDAVAINLVPMILADPPGLGPYTTTDPKTFESLSNAEVIKSLREREIVRVLNADGELIAAPYGLAEEGLPLSDVGLGQLQQGEVWWETARLNENLLILNRPVMLDGKLSMILQIARPLTERERSLDALRQTLIAAISLTMFAAVAIGWFFSGYFLRPIQKISQTARQIGDEQDFSRRVDYQGPQDEVGQLAVTFNTMLGKLEEAYKVKTQALEMQREFVADVSHELRTPLTTLRGNLSLLSHQPAVPPEEEADILKDMVDETERMIRLVNALLEQARADSARNIVRETVELQSLLEEAARHARQLDENRQIK
nr:HAMP domain-containing protein [Anaerolineaceae bacterium]